MDAKFVGLIVPNWTLVFCKNPSRWWVRLLAWGRYNHVKALAYLPTMRAWLFYDVKFHETRLMLVHEGDPATHAYLQDYLNNCDTIEMPRLAVPCRSGPQPGFWCTLAMKHLVGVSTGALRPDRLWRDCIAAGGRPHVSFGTRGEAFIAALRARMSTSRRGGRRAGPALARL